MDYGVKSDTFTQEVRAAYTGARYNWVVGAYYFHEELSQDQPAYEFLDFDKVFGAHSGDGIAAIVYDTSRQVRNSEAIFGQGDYALTSRLKLTLGGRYTTEHETFSIIESEKVQNNGEGNFGPVTPLWAFSGLNQTNSAFNFRAALNYQITDSRITLRQSISYSRSITGGRAKCQVRPARAAPRLTSASARTG